MAEILLDSNAYKHNLNLIASTIKDKQKLALVLKDNAYGHGLEQISNLALNFGIKNVFVKNFTEALSIKDKFESITALYGGASGEIPKNIAMVINDKSQITPLPKGTKVELKVNIGMNRNGIESNELETFIDLILKQNLELFGIFAHNGYGDDLDSEFDKSVERFSYIKSYVKKIAESKGIATPRFHSLSSSGAIRVASCGEIGDDLVRIGIASYGYLDTAFANDISDKLKPVMSLWANRVSTRLLDKDSRIGYSGCTRLDSQKLVSTYDLGYGDGFFRINERKKLFTRDGLEILPRMSMDCFSAYGNADRICVFSDVRSFAKAFDTISYEILTHLSPMIKRTII